MGKRIYKSKTEQLKKRIKSGSVDKSQLSGEALAYYNRVKGAAKGREAKAGKVFMVGSVKMPRDSELYRIVEAAAKAKGMSVKEFVKENEKTITGLLTDGDVVVNRESDYAMRDIASVGTGKRIFVNDGNGYVRAKKNETIFALQQLKMHAAAVSDIFLIFYLIKYKVNGDLYIYNPNYDEYVDLVDEEFMDFLDGYYPHITYVNSDKNSKQQDELGIRE